MRECGCTRVGTPLGWSTGDAEARATTRGVSLDNNLLFPSPSSSPPLPLSSLLVGAPRATTYRFLYSPGSSMPTPFFSPRLTTNTTMSRRSRTETRWLPCFLFDAQNFITKGHTLHHSLRTWWQYRLAASRGRANSQSTCKETRAGRGAEQEVFRSAQQHKQHPSLEQASNSRRDHTGPYG
jgi:hypothetical protein